MTDPDQRIAELERQLLDTRRAAVAMMVGMADAIASTPDGRADLARGFDDAARHEAGETRNLARLVAEALRAK